MKKLFELSHSGSVLYITSDEASKWSLVHGQEVSVRFGCCVAPAALHVEEHRQRQRMSVLLRARLHFPSAYRGNLLYHVERKEVQIGPLIGFLTMPQGGKSGAWDSNLYSGLQAAARHVDAFTYAFSPRDVDWSSRLVRGHYRGRGAVKQLIVPLADVIYNRVSNRSQERTALYRHFLKRVADNQHPYLFNPHFFNKWQVHRWLSSDGEVRQYLPETRLLGGVRDMERIVSRHGHAYVKPLGGSQGKGIVRVAGLKEGGYAVHYRTGASNVLHYHANFAEAASEVLAAKERRGYLVQQGLTLAKYRGSTFDVRVTMHKQGSGEWEVVGPAAKVAVTGAVTTHVHNGGRVYPLKKVLREVFPQHEADIFLRLVVASKKIAVALERACKLRLGELGLDLGITPRGEVYLFEVNARPGRMVFAPGWARKDGRHSLRCLTAFAHYAAGFGEVD